jgi:hypothetical protein
VIWIASALALADLLTTIVGVKTIGPQAESNLVFLGFLSRYGVEAFAAVYLAGAALLIAAASQFDGALAGLSAILVIILANNLFALWRIYRASA